MKKSELRNIIREVIIQHLNEDGVMDKTIKNPETGNPIKVATALTYDKKHPAYKAAQALLGKKKGGKEEKPTDKKVNIFDKPGDKKKEEPKEKPTDKKEVTPGTPEELANEININTMKPDKEGDMLINNQDFAIKVDTFGKDTYTLNWIKNHSNKFKGKDIFKKTLAELSKNFGDRPVNALGARGFDIVKDENGKKIKVQLNGYYSILRWGFIPEKGVSLFNKILKTDYKTVEEAFDDPNFWPAWKEKGVEYAGQFDMTPGSLSWKMLEGGK